MTDSVSDRDAFGAARLALLSALMDSDVKTAERLVQAMLADGHHFDRIVEGLFMPVQGEVGRRWATGDLGVADEHAATETVGELLMQLSAVAEAPTGPKVVVATPEFDAHGLGARFVAAALALEGFNVVSLGASVPPEDLGDYLDAQEPAALTLSCSVTAALASAARSIAVSHAAGVPVVIGGRAVPRPERAQRLGADGFAGSARDAVAVLSSWADAPPTSLAPAPNAIPEQSELRLRGSAVIAAAVGAGGAHATRPDRLADEMRRLLLVAESALLLGEDGLVGEHLMWLRSIDPAHGVEQRAVDAAVAAAVQACDGALARVGRVLDGAVQASRT